MEDLITVEAAAVLKGVSVATLYKAIREGRLPSQRVLGRVGLRPADVAAFEPKRGGIRPGSGRPRKEQAA
jgi:excisionase family DNA binding protein